METTKKATSFTHDESLDVGDLIVDECLGHIGRIEYIERIFATETLARERGCSEGDELNPSVTYLVLATPLGNFVTNPKGRFSSFYVLKLDSGFFQSKIQRAIDDKARWEFLQEELLG